MSRAKRVIKKKVPIIRIILLITLVGGIIAGILSYNPQIRQEIASLISGKVESYDINDCVKAAYTEGDNRYIPIYYNNYKEQITAGDIISKFAERGVEVESISSTTIGTGTVIKTKSTVFGTTYNSTYTVIIYGDVNGDGKVNVLDINRIVEYYLNKGEGSSNLTGAYAKAANVEQISKNQINVLDINRIVGFMFYDNAVVEVLPYSDRATDKTAPNIELNGDSTVRVIIGEKYNELGVTVKDNLDPHVRVTANPDPNSIDTSYEHDVTITYTAEDVAGNKSTITRTVIVEPKSDVKIELNHPDKSYIALSLGEEYDPNWLGANAVNMKNGIEGESLQVTGPTWDKEFDKNVAGIYKVTYSASNSQTTASITQVIEIINPVKNITLDVTKAKNRYDGKNLKEDSELDLSDIMVTLARKQGADEGPISVSELLTTYQNQFEIKVNEFNGTKVTYESPADKNATVSKNLTVSLTWTNPAESADIADKTAQGTENIGTANIIGKISEILVENALAHSGDIYTNIEATFKTPASQEGFVASATNDINVLKAEIKKGTNGHCKISTIDGVAKLTFWGELEQEYEIEVYTQNEKGQKITYAIPAITLTRSGEPNRILVTKQYNQDFLKAGGTPGEYKLLFKRIYTNPDTGREMPPYSVNIETSNISIGYGMDGNSTSSYLTGAITKDASNNTAATLRLTPIDTNIDSDVSETVKIYVDGKNIQLEVDGTQSNLDVTIKPKAQFSLAFDAVTKTENGVQFKDDVVLYYKTPTSSTNLEGSVKNIDGTLYTLCGVSFVDQYGDKEKNIINSMLTTTTDTNYSISFSDNGTQKIIKTIGFKLDGNPCQNPTDIVRYIGIGIDKTAKNGDEDEEFVSRGLMKGGANSITVEQGGTVVAKLNVKEIVKNDITTLRTSKLSASDYRYSVDEDTENAKKPRIIAEIKSGATELNLIPADLTYKVENGSTDVTSETTIEGETSTTGLGRINVRFRAKTAGIYKITVGVRNKPSATTSFNITIKEDPRINMVQFTGNRKVTPTLNFGEVAYGTPVTREIIYYHDYSDIAGSGVSPVEISEDSVPVINGGTNPNQITITGNSSLTVSAVKDYPSNPSNIAPGSGKEVTHINVECKSTTVSIPSFTVKLNQTINDGITTTWSKEIEVPVTPVSKIEMQSVKISNLSGGNNAVLAYKMSDSEIPADYQDQIKNIGNTTYSIFKVWYEDKSGAAFKVKANEIADEQIIAGVHKVLVTDDKANEGTPFTDDANIEVTALYRDADKNYAERYDDTLVDFVGISLKITDTIGIKVGDSIGAFLNPGNGWYWRNLRNDSKLNVTNVLGSPKTINIVSTTTFDIGDSVEEVVPKATVNALQTTDLPKVSTPTVSIPSSSSTEQGVKSEEDTPNGSAEIVTKPNEGTVTEEDNKPSGEEIKTEEITKPEDTATKPSGTVSDKPKEPEDKKEQGNPQSDLLEDET